MIVKYWVNCFDRELNIRFAKGDLEFGQMVEDVLDKAYDIWHSPEEVEDFETREHVQESCCEEYMMEYLSQTLDNWLEWRVEGDVDENGNEEPIYVIKNPELEHYTQTYITLDAEELLLLGIEKEYWDDCEVINDCIHNMIYERGSK